MFIASRHVSTVVSRQIDYIPRSGGTLTLLTLTFTNPNDPGDAVLSPNDPGDVTVNGELTMRKMP
jgi:hypothetical protein